MQLKLIGASLLMLSASVLMSGCNNDSHDLGEGAAQPAPSTDDSFIAQVRLQTDGANAMSETAEPIDIMQISETSPEQNEPQTVTF